MFKSANPKEDLYQFIIKRHAYYEAKLDVIDDKINIDFDRKIDLNSGNSTTNSSFANSSKNLSEDERIEGLIRIKRTEIEQIKRKMINEEKNLLGLYKIKRNK